MDKRVPVFLVCSVAAAALVPFADFPDQDFRWVAGGTSAMYFLLAMLVLVDWLSRKNR